MAKAEKQRYAVLVDGWLMGQFHKAGDVVELYPAQAAGDMAPHGSMLAAAPAPAADKPVAAQPPKAPAVHHGHKKPAAE